MMLIKTNQAFGGMVKLTGRRPRNNARRFVTPRSSGRRRSVMNHDL
jgi:hypothetical protein